MNAIWAICRRDLIAAFTTPLAWLVLAAWTMLTNGAFCLILDRLAGTPGSVTPLMEHTFAIAAVCLCLLVPALTMHSFATERMQGTLPLLLTMPINDLQIVLGKYAAALGVLAALLAATMVQPLALVLVSEVAWPSLVTGYLGLALLGALLLALGQWLSVLVDSPVVALVLTLGTIALLLLLDAGAPGSTLGALAATIGPLDRVGAFFRGDVRLGDASYFLAGSIALLSLAQATLDGRRHHG
jgi:ABC-2 type transport system permease protein